METETPAPRPRRSNPWLLVVLGLAVAAFFATRTWSGSTVTPAPTSIVATSQKKDDAHVDPKELKVRLEALEAARPEEGSSDRNPFRFQAKAAPTPPPSAFKPPPVEAAPEGPPPPPPIPPIPLKYMGSVEKPGGVKIAALSDCRAATFAATEGETVDGRYRIVKIGIESLMIEYVDGKGRQTLRREGCPPR
jgi:hypothetical protein